MQGSGDGIGYEFKQPALTLLEKSNSDFCFAPCAVSVGYGELRLKRDGVMKMLLRREDLAV